MQFFMAIYTNGINIERVYGEADVIKAVSGGEYIIDDTIEGNLRWRKVLQRKILLLFPTISIKEVLRHLIVLIHQKQKSLWRYHL